MRVQRVMNIADGRAVVAWGTRTVRRKQQARNFEQGSGIVVGVWALTSFERRALNL
jgi:hypothetical protein